MGTATNIVAAVALAAAGCRCGREPDDDRLRLEVPVPAAPRHLALESLAPAKVRWNVDVGPAAPVPDLVAHPPLVVGDRVIVAGSRIGYVALDRATGAVAWRRPASPTLANPVEIEGELLLVHDCEGEVAAPPGEVALACFDRIDARDVAARTAGVIHVPEADLAGCAPSGAWRLTATVLIRGDCRWSVAFASGAARRTATPPLPAPDDDVVHRDEQATWRRETHDGKSYVHTGGARLPGLTVLAASPRATVVRFDSTLRNDYVAVDDRAWWPLPPPSDVRSTPVAVGGDARLVVVLFDGSRVAALTAP